MNLVADRVSESVIQWVVTMNDSMDPLLHEEDIRNSATRLCVPQMRDNWMEIVSHIRPIHEVEAIKEVLLLEKLKRDKPKSGYERRVKSIEQYRKLRKLQQIAQKQLKADEEKIALQMNCLQESQKRLRIEDDKKVERGASNLLRSKSNSFEEVEKKLNVFDNILRIGIKILSNGYSEFCNSSTLQNSTFRNGLNSRDKEESINEIPIFETIILKLKEKLELIIRSEKDIPEFYEILDLTAQVLRSLYSEKQESCYLIRYLRNICTKLAKLAATADEEFHNFSDAGEDRPSIDTMLKELRKRKMELFEENKCTKREIITASEVCKESEAQLKHTISKEIVMEKKYFAINAINDLTKYGISEANLYGLKSKLKFHAGISGDSRNDSGILSAQSLNSESLSHESTQLTQQMHEAEKRIIFYETAILNNFAHSKLSLMNNNRKASVEDFKKWKAGECFVRGNLRDFMEKECKITVDLALRSLLRKKYESDEYECFFDRVIIPTVIKQFALRSKCAEFCDNNMSSIVESRQQRDEAISQYKAVVGDFLQKSQSTGQIIKDKIQYHRLMLDTNFGHMIPPEIKAYGLTYQEWEGRYRRNLNKKDLRSAKNSATLSLTSHKM